jgi:hypothetical protein
MDNIKMDLLEIGTGGVGWIGLAQDRYRWRALGKLLGGCTTCGLSSGAQPHRVSLFIASLTNSPVGEILNSPLTRYNTSIKGRKFRTF